MEGVWIYQVRSNRRLERTLDHAVCHGLYSLPNVITLIKLRRMKLVGDVACVREERCLQCFGRESEGKKLFGRP